MRVLDLTSAARPLPHDVHGKRVTGSASEETFPGNFVDCLLDHSGFQHVYFDATDFTNCVVQNAIFDRCHLHQGSITGCAFIECEFLDTTIDLYASHDCIFVDTSFRRIRFVNSLVRHSRVNGCEILDSFVTNQVFDECLLLESKFRDTAVDFRIVLDNFGVLQETVPATAIRRTRSEVATPAEGTLEAILEKMENPDRTISPIERFKIQYYLINSFDFDGDIFDQVFDKASWYNVALTPGSLTRSLDHFSELLLHMFRNGKTELHSVTRLHSLSHQIYQELRDAPRYASIAQTAVGIHVRTGDIINQMEWTLDALSQRMARGQSLRFRTSDGVTESEVEELGAELTAIGWQVEFRPVRRNSPLDLIASPAGQTVVLLAALFTLTRFEFELRQISENLSTNTGDKEGDEKVVEPIAHSLPSDEDETNPLILNFALGFPQERGEPLVSLTSRTAGQRLVKTSITVNTDIIRRARRALHNIFTENGDGPAGA